VFDRVRALNPQFMTTGAKASKSASVVVCLRSYVFAAIRAAYDGLIAYDAIELEYAARTATALKAPNAVRGVRDFFLHDSRSTVAAGIELNERNKSSQSN
jgi:hypothetical protein